MAAYKEREYPEVGELLVATVTRIVDYGAYVTLDEYTGMEGLIHISEISSTWVRNIRDHVREGQKLVLKVLRVDPQREQVDLSLRRVTGREKTEKMLEWKKGRKADSIVKGAAEKLKGDMQIVEKVKRIIYENYENPYDAFEEAIEEGEEVLTKLGIEPEWAKALLEVAKSKVRLEQAKIQATLELTCYKPDGIEAIRSALKSAKKVRRKGAQIRIYAVGAPRYRVEVVSRTYETAEAVLNQVVKEALSSIASLGGEGRRVS